MVLTVTLDTDNDAFADNPGAEAARILRKLANKLEREGMQPGTSKMLDENGNTTGRCSIG